MIRLSFTLLALVTLATQVHANPLVDQVTEQLVKQGYQRIEVSRTFLGRIRIEATGGGSEREVVLNPRTGQILRDHWESDGKDDAQEDWRASRPERGSGRPQQDDDDVYDSVADVLDREERGSRDDRGRDDFGRDDDDRGDFDDDFDTGDDFDAGDDFDRDDDFGDDGGRDDRSDFE